MKEVYYAHCVSIYDTPQEDRDIVALEDLGFEVVNPNSTEYNEAFEAAKANPDDSYDQAFNKVFGYAIQTCRALAFRALPDGRISTGVFKEILIAKTLEIPIIELPSSVGHRSMSVAETMEYLHEIGQR